MITQKHKNRLNKVFDTATLGRLVTRLSVQRIQATRFNLYRMAGSRVGRRVYLPEAQIAFHQSIQHLLDGMLLGNDS